jgi:hypothetical protein
MESSSMDVDAQAEPERQMTDAAVDSESQAKPESKIDDAVKDTDDKSDVVDSNKESKLIGDAPPNAPNVVGEGVQLSGDASAVTADQAAATSQTIRDDEQEVPRIAGDDVQDSGDTSAAAEHQAVAVKDTGSASATGEAELSESEPTDKLAPPFEDAADKRRVSVSETETALPSVMETDPESSVMESGVDTPMPSVMETPMPSLMETHMLEECPVPSDFVFNTMRFTRQWKLHHDLSRMAAKLRLTKQDVLEKSSQPTGDEENEKLEDLKQECLTWQAESFRLQVQVDELRQKVRDKQKVRKQLRH